MIFSGNMVKVLTRGLKKDLPVILLLLLPLFFYKLGQSSLVSWDEAWYAEISRNIVKSGDLFNLVWNGAPFSDKPPGQFWIEALVFKFFGVSEFTARIPSAIAGLLSLLLIYLIGKSFSRGVGLMSALALGSSIWFLYRARSGNLDVMLTFFYLLTFYLGMLVAEKRKFLLPFALSFAYLPMIKGIVFVPSLIPSLVSIFWGKLKLKDYLLPVIALSGLFGSWILIQYLSSPSLVLYHFSHSLRDSSIHSNVLDNFKLFKEYVHSGIGRWFWPGILGILAGLVLKNKKLLAISVFPVFYSLQFMFSSEIQIWQLIPLYPFMILAFFGSIFVFLKKFPRCQLAVNTLVLVFTLYISLTQIKQMWYSFVDIPAFVSDEQILSTEAGKYPYPFYIDSSFEPAAVFYSGKNAKWVNEFYLADLFKKSEPFVMIIKQSMLDKLKIEPKSYKILKADRDKILILYQPTLW